MFFGIGTWSALVSATRDVQGWLGSILALRTRVAVELHALAVLVPAHTSSGDPGTRVALGSNRGSGHTAHHRQLADMRQRVRDRTLEDHLEGQRLGDACGEGGIERRQGAEEAVHRSIPGR